MKKMLSVFLILMMMSGTAWASLVNMTKPGTSWVWRVEAGDERTFLRLEDENVWLTEDSKVVLLECAEGEHLYNALLGQGWIVSDLPANIPQSLDRADIGLIELNGVGGGLFILEDGTSLRREAIEPNPHAIAYDRALNEDGTYLVNEDETNLRMEN